MKNFISLRRKQLKALESSEKTSQHISKLILDNDAETFTNQINNQSPEFVYSYLFSQDQLLKSPLLLTMEQPKWSQLLRSINAWSNKNIQLINKNFEPALKSEEQNQPNGLYYFLKSTFENIVRVICKKNQEDFKQLVQIFSVSNTLLSMFMKYFLTYENLKPLISQNKQLKFFQLVFTPISENLQLESAADISKFGVFKLREKTWIEKSFSQFLTNPEILILKEMNYNFMHELAIKKDEKSILEILSKFEEDEDLQNKEDQSQLKESFFCSFDTGNQTPLDIILGKWTYQSIKKFLDKAKDIECVHFSVNCLNKVICNRLLNESQIQTLIDELLNGEVGGRGYSQRIIKEKLIKRKGFQKVIKRQSSDYVIVLDRRRALMAKDKKQSYPLLNYLDRFKQKCSLKIIAKLFFQLLDRQVIKTKVISVLSSIGIECKQFEAQNEALKQIQQVIYYHQSLLDFICRLPQNDLMQFFVDKLFINYFTISIWSKTNGNPVVHMINRHFLTNYIQNSQNLSETSLNQKILAKIFDAKDNQKFVNNFNIYVELLRQFKQSKKLSASTQWLPLQVKQKIRECLKKLEKQKFSQLYTNMNAGQKQNKVELGNMLDGVFTPQQIKEFFSFTIKPVAEPENKKNINEINDELTKIYKRKKTFENFQKVVINQVEMRRQNRIQRENFKKKLQQNVEQNFKQEQQVGGLQPGIMSLYWNLQMDEADLQKKLERLIKQGYQISFKTNKFSILGQNQLQNRAISTLNQPYKSLLSAILDHFYEAKTKQKLLLHEACFIVKDEDVDKICKFLQSASKQFLGLMDWEHFNKFKIAINPLMLLKVIKSPTLSQEFKLTQQNSLNEVFNNIKFGIESIIQNIKSRPEKGTHIKKMLAYRELAKLITKNPLKGQQKDQNKYRYKAYIRYFEEYMQLHSQKINLSQYFKEISIDQLLDGYSSLTYVKALKASPSPYALLLQTIKILQPLHKQHSQLKIQLQQIIDQETQQVRRPQSIVQQQIRVIENKLEFDFMRFNVFRQNIKIYQFVDILNKLTDNEFSQYIKLSVPNNFNMFCVLIQKLVDENKCFKVLDLLVEKSMEANAPVDLKQFYKHTRRLLKPQKNKFNTAVSAFVSSQIRKFMNYQILAPKRIILHYKQFIEGLDQANYKVFLQYLTKMLLLPSFLKNSKEEILFYLFGIFYNGEDWKKGIALLEMLRSLRPQIAAKEGTWVNSQSHPQIKLIQQFLQHSIDLIAKNKSRRFGNNKQLDKYADFVKLLLKLIEEQKIQQNQQIFQNAWIVNPVEAVKIIKINEIQLLRLAKCIQKHPSQLKLLQKIKISQNMPTTYKPKQQGLYLPLSEYSVHEFGKLKYQVDLMIFQEKLRKIWVQKAGEGIKKYEAAFNQKKKSVFLTKQVMDRYKQVYSEEEIKKYCGQIFSSNTLESLQNVPKAYLDTYFASRKQIIGVSNLKQKILRELIDKGHLTSQHLNDMIKSCRMPILQYFLQKTKTTIDYKAIQKIQQANPKKNSFILSLLYLENQKFSVDFVSKYKIFNLYPEYDYQEMVKDVLWGIALLRRTAFLKLFLAHLTQRNNGKNLKFEEAKIYDTYIEQARKLQALPEQPQPNHKVKPDPSLNYYAKQAQNSGVINQIVYLPMKVAASNNFYQYYFLLLQNGVKPQTTFEFSGRFLFEINPEQFAFIPLMKKKVEFLKIIYQYMSSDNFRPKISKNLPTQKERKQFIEHEYALNGIILSEKVQPSKRLDYFLKFIQDPDSNHLEPTNMYIVIALLKTLPGTPIPDEALTKLYPEETKLVNFLLLNWKFTLNSRSQIHSVLQDYELLRDLLYVTNPKYLIQASQHESIQKFAILFSRAFTTQLRYFQQPQNTAFLQKFIHQCYFQKQRQPFRHQLDQTQPFDYNYNEQKMKDILICCLMSRYEGNGKAFSIFCKETGKSQDELIIDLAFSMCNFRRFNAVSPLDQNNFRHNFGLWSSIVQAFKKMDKIKKIEKNAPFKPFFCEKYAQLIKFQQNKKQLTKSSQGLLTLYAALTYLNNLLYLIGQQKQTQQQIQQNKDHPQEIKLILSNQYSISKKKDNTLICTIPYQIIDSPPIKTIRIDSQETIKQIERILFWQKLTVQEQIIQPYECLSKLTFKLDIGNLKNIKSLDLLKKVLADKMYHNSLTYCIEEYMKDLTNIIEEQKDGKIYSLSDVFGPVVINDQTDKNKVVECLSFYQFCKLSESVITIQYTENPNQKTSSYLISDIRQYIRYFTYEINDDQSQNKTPYKFNKNIIITPRKNNPDSFTILYNEFYVHNIVRFVEKINKFGREISATFNYQVLFKYSTSSIFKIVELFEKEFGAAQVVIDFVCGLLSNRRHIAFVEELLLMISEDANNIMKAVKGILLVFQYSTDISTKGDQKPYKSTDKISYYGLDFKIDDQVFKIFLKVGPTKKQSKQVNVAQSNLISRKDFLNTVFSSTQFLTGYFMNKSALANELVKNSKQISRTVNSVVNLSISYKELENFVDKIKQKFTIKQMDGFLTNLNSYITTNYNKFINSYISSRQLAVQHQVSLLKYFQKLNIKTSSSQPTTSTILNTKLSSQIKMKVKGNDLNRGIKLVYNFSSQLKSSNNSEVNIKNMYLIQIYKNYFASVVSQGMMFILGFKTNKPTLVIKLQKKQDIDKVNISELSFLLLISNRVPTNDQINHEKIIKIFVTDLNQNIYELNKNLTEKQLSLPEQSDQRTLANVIPIIQSNIILVFNSQYSKKDELKDDTNHRYLELNLTKENKFKIKLKNQAVISCIDMLKIDVMFNTALENLGKLINLYVDSNIVVTINVPSSFESSKAAQILNMAFLDVDQMFTNLFFEPPRNKDLELFASAEAGEDLRQNLILKGRRKFFESLYEEIRFEICSEGDSKILIQNKTIKILLAPKISHTLNASLMSDTLLKDQIQKILKSNQKLQKLYSFENKVDDLASILDHLLIGRYQIEAIDRVLQTLKQTSLSKVTLKNYLIKMKGQQKSAITYQKQCLTLTIRLKSPKRQFFTNSQILQFVLNNFKQTIEGLSYTKFNNEAKNIELYNYQIDKPATLILVSKQKTDIRQIKLLPEQGNLKKCIIPFTETNYKKYYVIQKQGQAYNVATNYFWSSDSSVKYISEKKNIVLTKQKQTLLLFSPTPINMSQCSINAYVHLSKNQKANEMINITKKNTEFDAKIYQLSKQILKLQIIPNFSSNINIQLGKFRLLNNQSLQNIILTSTSGKAMVQQNTKFIQLLFRNKVLKPSMSQNDKKQQNITFNQPAQKVSIANSEQKKKEKSVEQMVYIVNEHARKFLTRAGEPRTDVINVCDEEGNVINFNPATKIFFRHLNIDSQIIVPEIKYDAYGTRIELKWTPTVRGPYEVFLNTTRLNPNYEIGVCAAVIDIKSCKIQPPKKIDLCFMEQTQCSLTLKDCFGNIYTELEEAIINDQLIIQIQSEEIPKNMIRMKADKIDKYGLKKIRFSIDDPNGLDQRDIVTKLLINMETVAQFTLKIKGQSLGQRRKNLQKDIEGATKKYYLDITVSRSNFMQSLFKIAQKSLDKTFSVKFANQQGIDAGGLKRQFYDMIGKQMKDPQNPFFIQTDSTRHNEYFINPQIIKNKKKLQYMNLFGKYLANSFLNGYLIGINFSTTFVKLLYEDTITFEDMLTVLPKEQASRYEYLATADAEYIDDLEIYFSCILNRKKGIEVQMKQDGKNIKVTKDNVHEYLKLLPEFLIVRRYQQLIDSFRSGFDSVFKIQIPRKWIRTDQFWCMTAGVRQITPQIVLNYVVIRGGKQIHHAWFRSYITQASQQILQGFLKFSSGSSSIDFYQSSKITVQFENQGENPKKLPISHTCWKQIEIPAYKSFAIMKQLLNAAFLYCSEGFGFG